MKRLAALVGLAILIVASSADATRIEFVWASTGTSSISARPGDEVVVQMRVIVEENGIVGVAVSSLATPGLVEAVAFELCPDPTGCGPSFDLMPIGVSNIILNTANDGLGAPIPGLSGSFAALSPPPFNGVSDGSFVLANLTYRVTGLGSGEVVPYYREGVDGAVDSATGFDIPLGVGADITSGISLMVIPEPGTFALLATGVLGLAFRRRRRAS